MTTLNISSGGQKPEPELDWLSNIIREFNDRFGNIKWKDQDKIEKVIAEELPTKVAGDRAYQNAMANSDRQNARIEHDKALERAMTELLGDHTELFKQSATTTRSAGGSPRWSSPRLIRRQRHLPVCQAQELANRGVTKAGQTFFSTMSSDAGEDHEAVIGEVRPVPMAAR